MIMDFRSMNTTELTERFETALIYDRRPFT